ncbi:pimeloyl-ACP methyl ester carboxylesterase [Herbihabitans rhizosphaerae]|uniref:Pimeloyl-ACP methyl ester carboxylesterase n=1 Tax=Herbihabitans rhizosphaerae TaxID=1872711 RepID=A0A4Q7KF95_9PSEU|nr:alpha/beta hydrolase [Herbihabitans rhizosphaerae]RZS32630.1 pimeloyl-ACP methyl ester carboxylesterase [Herbihabitans rhizosphaerae]
MTITSREIEIHGHRVSYRRLAGGGTDPLVLLHGIAGSGRTWLPVMEELADRGYGGEVIAPDLLGHGESATPRGDYSMGAFAAGLRDLLLLLGHKRATIVGHSLGGGIALQFAYQFPELCGRIVLAGSGGLGKEVTPLIRATDLPGAKLFLAAVVNRTTVRAASAAIGKMRRPWSAETRELAQHLASLADPAKRTAYVHTARTSTDIHGQRASAIDRLYLSEVIPSMIIWGDRDKIIPVSHAHEAARLMPGSRLEIVRGAGHFIHSSDPHRFSQLLIDFLESTEPATLDTLELAELLRERLAE